MRKERGSFEFKVALAGTCKWKWAGERWLYGAEGEKSDSG